MLDKIIHFSIHNKFVIGLFTLALILVGSYSLMHLPMDTQPDITNNQVQIITSSPTLATQEVEKFITYPIEQAVKSIPNIVELRSISRFGLSVVTVVFKEEVDIYWARTQVSEHLKTAEEVIPKNVGRPELAPVSTGLGEIYQYIVYPDAGFEEQYTPMELRSIQDWIIKPQLIGIPGVAEINTLGGELKQYEISVQPDRLKSMNTNIGEIFDALERNNENTGGAYIDKKPYAYFIRSIGMISSLEDIEKIVVKTTNGIPVLIRDVATVQIGSGIRYGAVTKDGKGEEVSGMVMMLKGGNSKVVVNLVKEKMEQIRKSLPKGVLIEPFIDRTTLVDKTINTIQNNLIEGALIVVFVLVMLLGNWRAGIVVASVIPLSMLFAISLMKAFGVSGNLMSLGAIDFGLIVDGAVIVVEAILHRLQIGKKTKLTKAQMNTMVYEASSKIRTSASFGEIIILIVYLPILALVGIEGKMFGPMAQTVSFAILGAFILSLTYVPMMTSLVLKKESGKDKPNFSDRIIQAIYRAYEPILQKAMRIKKTLLLLAFSALAASLFVFNQLGGEFIPTLDEGDLATHIIISSGSSLSQEIETTTKAEKILKERFPEVKMVVTKIGSAEIPTDPMPMEAGDMIIVLKDKKEWTSAKTKEELMHLMEDALQEIPGITTEFSQPIQMRFNELMTGVRSDVAIKVFGEDLEKLVSKGEEIQTLIQDIPGVTDPKLERVAGLPQIAIRYNKDKLALYGLNIGDINKIVRTGFAGEIAGTVYEGEKRFDLVVRMAENNRQDITNIKSLFITLPSGHQIPLEQVADIDYEDGPMQISREDGRRRIVLGFNVRGNDVQTVVEQIQSKLDGQLVLPEGYYLTYGGQFENLIQANQRLSIAIPIALSLIFILLFFTFKSVAQSLMVFTAIPLSAIGGIAALWMRDMPFSISAGVGFIALFGVAVLNGIVLIGQFNLLKKEGVMDIEERIFRGTKIRLRPVILTAAVASLGFLPMALSTGAGAEVQKPLATVVIGGLLTATLLTLIILPILYYYVERGFTNKSPKKVAIIALVFGLPFFGFAQEAPKKSLQQLIEIGLENNLSLQANKMEMQVQKQLQKTAFDVPKTELTSNFGQLNSTTDRDVNFGISQSFNPFVISSRKQLLKQNYQASELQWNTAQKQWILQLKQSWYNQCFYLEKEQLLLEQNALLKEFSKSATWRYTTGETNVMESQLAQLKQQELEIQIQQNQAMISQLKRAMKTLLNSGDDFELEAPTLENLTADYTGEWDVENNNLIREAAQKVAQVTAEKNVKKSALFPDITMGYAIESLAGLEETNGISKTYGSQPRLSSFSIGLAIPIFSGSQRAAIKAGNYEIEKSALEKRSLEQEITQSVVQQQQWMTTQRGLINYYQNAALPQSETLGNHALKSYQSGAISYVEYLQAVETALSVKLNYKEALLQWHLAQSNLDYLIN
ncbi:CusA/CzcA family heavy metal efflux RND transporter [Flavobacterium sp. JP2137]|uniref:CusA/CzcA family heavy metal efflux RND transporter n=1 Tax=Flavobacterium sp. JP2137 TaxID=3414510 RepID=UPI003D2FCD43